MHIKVDHVTKIFGKLRANDDITLSLQEGTIYAILGENGAGKSTLMKILSGYQPADAGNIVLDGKTVRFGSPADALRCGIGMLHQDPLDVAVLTVLENFLLGRPSGLIPDRKRARVELVTQCQRLGFTLNPDAYIDSLTIGERQQLEIARLLCLGAKVIILDEPTTGISTEQKDMLFGALKRLATQERMTVILVSHKLEDVEMLCDHVIVLRQGKVVGEQALPCPISELVALMFGQPIERTPREHVSTPQETLRVSDLSVQGRRLTVHNVDLTLHAGEIVGLAGLDGSGQDAFLRAVAGLQALTSGRVLLSGQNVTKRDYHSRAGMGVAFAPAGRLEEGLVQGLTLTEHFALTTPKKRDTGRIDWKRSTQQTMAQIDYYHIRGQAESEVQTLSGGNQQRTLIALLPADLKLLLLEDPTRGLDVESSRWVWTQLLDRCKAGTAILFTSPDLDEIIEYSDRVLVFFGGQVTMVDDPARITVAQLGSLIGGKSA
jgi:simple sugar transport system ATP-binding protein